MTLDILALVLASAAIHATWNLWAKQMAAARQVPLLWLMVAISSVLYAAPAVWVMRASGWRPDPRDLVFLLGSGVIHVAYFFLLLGGYRRADLSVVYPVARGSGPLLASVSALVLFAERATPWTVAGLVLVATGILTLTGRPAGGDGRRLGAGLRWGLATGALIAVYTLWDGWAVKREGIPPLVFYWGGEVVRVIVLLPFVAADPASLVATWRSNPARIFGVAALSPLGYILILLAMRSGAVSHVAPAREVSILIGAFLGGAVLGEGQRRRRLAAAAAFVAGIAALALGKS